MFISTRKHLAIIKEIRTYWSNELYKARTENARLTAQLEAKASFETVQDTSLPDPLPAFTRPKYRIMHVVSHNPRKTVCGEAVAELDRRKTGELRHDFTCLAPRHTKLRSYESWCADCLG